MINPVIGNRKYLFTYLIVWAIFSLAHSFLLIYFYSVSPALAFIDGLVYNIVYLLLGLGIWFIVNYNPFKVGNIGHLIVAHFLSAMFIMAVWLSVAGIITGILLGTVKLEEPFSMLTPVRIMLGIIYYLIIALVYYLMVYNQSFKERVENEAKTEAKYREAELNTLKAQINPHFIFNSLNSISALTISDPETAQEMIVKLSEFFRMTLKKDNAQFAKLSEEIRFSRLYFEIEKIRFKEKLEYIIECDEKYGSHVIPHLIIQPLLENAIKHGVQESITTVCVKLECTTSNDYLVMKLTNAFDSESEATGEGIGLKNVRDRLRLIYNRSDLMEVEIIDNQYVAILKIPLS